MPDRGLTSWTDGLSARERVKEVAMALTQPRSVEWIREQAQVSSWQTAKDALEMLTEFGQVHSIEGDDGPKYAPNYQLRCFNEVTELINEHTRDELREEIAEWKDMYAVESREDLESTLTDDGLSGADVRERNTALRRWE